MAATKLFTPAELKVFDQLPADETTSRIHETFCPKGGLDHWYDALLEESFGAWPDQTPLKPYNEKHWPQSQREIRSLNFASEPNIELRLIYLPAKRSKELQLYIITEDELPALARVIHDEIGFQIPDAPQNGVPSDHLRHALQSDAGATIAFLLVRGDGSSDPEKRLRFAGVTC